MQYNITMKNQHDCAETLREAKKQATAEGGKITNEFGLIKGFTVELPEDRVSALASNHDLVIESDGEVNSQAEEVKEETVA